MSHIVSFSVAGLVGRDDVYSQKLNRDINIFFGLNGSGKTSLLRILHSAMSDNGDILENIPFDSAEVVIHSISHNTDYTRTISKPKKKRTSRRPIYRQQNITYEIENQPTDLFERDFHIARSNYLRTDELAWKTEPSDPSNTRWKHRYLPTWRLYIGDVRQRMAMSKPEALGREFEWDILFAERLKFLWSNYTNTLLSEVRKVQEEGLESILKSILSPVRGVDSAAEIDAETAYKIVRAFLQHRGSSRVLESREKFISHYKDNLQLRSIVSDIHRVEQRIENAMAARTSLEKLISRMFTGKKKLIFDDTGISVETDKGNSIGLESLSSGEKHVLSIFIESLLVDESSLMIDEPEISLHVDWQRLLISAMTQLNPAAQLIFATQAPEIMAEVPDSKIFRL